MRIGDRVSMRGYTVDGVAWREPGVPAGALLAEKSASMKCTRSVHDVDGHHRGDVVLPDKR